MSTAWTEEATVDLSAGSITDAEFEGLDLDELYLLVCKNVKAASTPNGILNVRFRSGSTDVTISNWGSYELDGKGVGLPSNTVQTSGGSGGTGYPVAGFSSPTDDLLDASDTATDDLDGQYFYLLFYLGDQGTVDPHGCSFRWLNWGTMLDGGVATTGAVEGVGVLVNNTDLPNKVDGIRASIGSNTFAAQGAITLYKYTGSVLT